MTQPKNQNVRDLAIWYPKVALGMVLGIPRVPFVVDMPLQFSSSTVNAPPIVTNFDNNVTQDTLIERVSYSLVQQNSFPGSPFQSLYLSQLKAQTGVGIQCQVFGGPKYVVNDTFTELANFADILATTWPQGWMLPKQSNVKVSAVLLSTPTSVPYTVNLTWLGWQSLSKDLDDLSDKECRKRLRRLGIETPDLDLLLMPPDARTGA
jgi:hypothetical protein